MESFTFICVISVSRHILSFLLLIWICIIPVYLHVYVHLLGVVFRQSTLYNSRHTISGEVKISCKSTLEKAVHNVSLQVLKKMW